MSPPLEGIRVLDLSINSPGPLATMMLADFGAEVIQIVRPGAETFGQAYAGDVAQDPYIISRFAPYDAVMRGKRSLALNLKSPRGREVFLRLVAEADVLIEEMRPGKMAKLGLGYADLEAINPRLIYCSITGYGQRGPLRAAAGHDINYLAMTGALDMIRGKDGAPVNPQNILSDNGGGSMSAVVGVLLALWQREKTGKGQAIDANCTDAVIYLMADLFSTAVGGGHPSPQFRGTFSGQLPNYRVYRCADDKWIAIGALERHFCQALFDGLEHPEWMDLLEARERWPELIERLEATFASKPRDAWVERFSSLDACVTPVLSLEETATHANTLARESIVTRFGIPQVGVAPKLEKTPGSIESPPARPGQHSQEILAEVGITAQVYEQWKAEGITG